MTIKEAKQVSIISFLRGVGHEPTKKRGDEYFYKSPYRDEDSPSFSVNEKLNCFYDFGNGKSGDIITLAQLMINKNQVSNALTYIQSVTNSFSFSQHTSLKLQEHPSREIKILKVASLANKALTDYLESRGISKDVAKKYCQEIYYQIGDKRYFAIAFRNNSGGYELRNKYSKISFAPKDVTLIQSKNTQSLLVFEGFIDFLSFIELNQSKNIIVSNFLILNSTVNIKKSNHFIERYKNVRLYLDNDDTGKRATKEMLLKHPFCLDCSNEYFNCKDLNEFLKQ